MATFRAPDGTELAYRLAGEGDPLVCLPGGPMRDSTYFGDLGGLGARRQLVLPDPRGTGRSAIPADPATYRCDRQVDDVEALRTHLGLERIDLLGHSAGANLAMLYAIRRPDRVGRLALVTPGLGAVAIDAPAASRLEVARLREGEPWFDEAYAALESVTSGEATPERIEAMTPFFYGRWDADMRAYDATQAEQRNHDAARVFGSDGAFDPAAIRTALATLDAAVLVLAGEFDINTVPGAAKELAGLFPTAEYVELPGAGHFPWMDDAGRFAATVGGFLG